MKTSLKENCNMIKKIFGVAVLAALLSGQAAVFAADQSPAVQPQVLQELLDGRLPGAALQSPSDVQVPLAAPARDEKAANGPAPAPGKTFTPVVQDAARVKAIMKLVSDIYNNRDLPYSQDGTTFKNKEGRLPQMPVGFYKEYTLLTGNAPHVVTIGDNTYDVAPDLSARGSERVIIGGGQKIYYTPDHYKNFILLEVVY